MTKFTSFTDSLWNIYHLLVIGASLVAQMVKHLPAMWETRVRPLGQEDPLEKGNGNPSPYSCLENSTDGGAWRGGF